MRWPHARLVPLLGVLLLVALVYAPTLNDPFAGDDYLVLGPVRALGGWQLTWKALILQDGIPYWRPLVSPLYAFEVHGIGLRPTAYHLIALALHLVNVALVYALMRSLVRSKPCALFAAALFGVAPAHTTTVAQISSTVELQSVVFYLLAVLFVVRFLAARADPTPRPRSLRGPGVPRPDLLHSQSFGRANAEGGPPTPRQATPFPRREGGRGVRSAFLVFILALLTKESTASAAAVIALAFVLLDPVRVGVWKRAGKRSLPFLALVPPYAVFTYLTDTSDPTGIARELYKPGWHIGQNLWWMAARLAAPLQEVYGPTISVAGHIGAAAMAAAAAMILVRGSAAARFLAGWTLIAMTPLTPWLPEMMLGRFTYQAAIPFSMLLALGADALVRRVRFRFASALIGACATAVVLGYGALTLVQNRERTREALAYGELQTRVERLAERTSPPPTITVVGGPFAGPYHALYLQAMADTLFGAGNVTLVWRPDDASAAAIGGAIVRWEQRR